MESIYTLLPFRSGAVRPLKSLCCTIESSTLKLKLYLLTDAKAAAARKKGAAADQKTAALADTCPVCRVVLVATVYVPLGSSPCVGCCRAPLPQLGNIPHPTLRVHETNCSHPLVGAEKPFAV